MSSKVIDRDLGWKRAERNLKFLNKSSVRVGVMSKSTSKLKSSKGKPIHRLSELLTIAIANEFGARAGRNKKVIIPERSFLRSTFDEENDAVSLFINRQYDVFVFKSPKLALDRVGIFFTGKVQRKIRNLKLPANAASTIRMKKSSNPLINTGQLRQSITHETTLVRSS